MRINATQALNKQFILLVMAQIAAA